MPTLPVLPLARYRLTFARLPAYAGSAWRGAGHALKRLVCVTREPACPPVCFTVRVSTPMSLRLRPIPASASSPNTPPRRIPMC